VGVVLRAHSVQRQRIACNSGIHDYVILVKCT